MRTLLIITLLALTPHGAYSDEPEEESAQAPPNHTLFRRSFGGAYFIPNALSEQYEELTSRVDKLRETLDTDDSDTANALREVEQLTKSLEALRAKIEKAERFVSPVKIFEQTDTYEFDLAQEPRVVIVADQIRLSSWDGPGIRCVLKKSIIAKEQPAAAEFKKLLVEHELQVPSELVGETEAERKGRTEAFFASEDGQKATEKQRAWRLKFDQEIADSQAKYREFQGQPAHILRVRGLGNGERTWISINLESDGGSGSSGGEWDRRAELTVHLPRQAIAAVLGCQVGVHVENYEGTLLLTTAESTDRDYNGVFTVAGVKGDFASYGVPLQTISQIEGAVTLDGTNVMRNGGTRHADGLRRMTLDLSGETSIRGIMGSLTARYLQTRLKVADITGTLDLENRYGPTLVELTDGIDLAGSHRIVTESGTIRLQLPQPILSLTPWTLYTQVGEVRVNVKREVLEDIHFSTGNHSWNGMITPRNRDEPGGMMQDFERPQAALDNEERTPGFDVISRAGRIVLQVEE